MTIKSEIKEIKPGIGLGILKFGMTRDQAKLILGSPDEIDKETYSDDEDDRTETWHFDDLELSLVFDCDFDWRLITLASSASFIELKSIKLVGKNIDDLKKTLIGIGISDLNEDWLTGEIPEHKVIESGDLGINFWIERDQLSEIQWAPLFLDDETIIWPE